MQQHPHALALFKQRLKERLAESLTLDPQGQELGQRVSARYNLIDFTRYTLPPYLPESFHYRVADELDQVVAGQTQRLMIFAPPQHGKSQLTAVHLPAFWLGHHPHQPVILASYGATLAETHSREARALVESEAYSRVFRTVKTQWQNRSVQRWKLKGYRGSLLAVGVGGPITGHGARLAIIDDPFSSWEMAYRQSQRDMVWNWYKGTFRTRLWEGGTIIIINTRWHEDDLCGRLLHEQADKWRVLRFPAIAESQIDRNLNDQFLGLTPAPDDPLGRQVGEPLCPQRFSLNALMEIRADVGAAVWSAEYQGVPRPTEGSQFKRHWFVIVDALPIDIVGRVRYWDRAATEGKGDYTVGLLMAKSRSGAYYVESVVRGQWNAGEVEKVILQTTIMDGQKYGHGVQIWIEEEGGSSGKESSAVIVKLLAGYAVYTERPSGSKEVRALPFAAQCQASNVRLLKGAWNQDYIEELVAFPSGRHDDQVDTSAGSFNKLALVNKTVVSSRVVTAEGLYK